MTAVPRDPAFWRRFSMAVHEQESKETVKVQASASKESLVSVDKHGVASASSAVDVEKYESTWLEDERRKQRWGRALLPMIFLSLILFGVVLAVVLWWLGRHNWFTGGEPVTFP